MSELDELRTLIREVIREVLSKGLPVTETVNLFTDEDLAAFVSRLLDLDPETREDLRAGRKRFRLGVPPGPQAPPVAVSPSTPVPTAPPGVHGSNGANGQMAVNGSPDRPARRNEPDRPDRRNEPDRPDRRNEPDRPDPSARRIERGAVTEKVVRDAARSGQRLVLGPRAVLTPLARDRARASGVEIDREDRKDGER